MSKEAMTLALEWFQWFHKGNTIESPKSSTQVKKALEEALAERQGDAVAEVVFHEGQRIIDASLAFFDSAPIGTKPYTHPAPAQQPVSNQSPSPEYDKGFSDGWDRGHAHGTSQPLSESKAKAIAGEIFPMGQLENAATFHRRLCEIYGIRGEK